MERRPLSQSRAKMEMKIWRLSKSISRIKGTCVWRQTRSWPLTSTQLPHHTRVANSHASLGLIHPSWEANAIRHLPYCECDAAINSCALSQHRLHRWSQIRLAVEGVKDIKKDIYNTPMNINKCLINPLYVFYVYRRILGIETIFAHLWRDVAATVVRSTRERTSIIYWWPMSCSPASCSCCTIWRTTSASSKRCGRRSPATVWGTLKIEFSVAESEMCNSSDWRTWDEKRTATSSWFQSTRVPWT